jgi:uncharacterized protein YkwD
MAPFAFLLPFVLNTALKKLPADPVPVPPDPTVVNKTLLIRMINDVRKKGCRCGDTWYPAAPAVTWNNRLEQAALVHSNDMYANNYFSHAAKDGSKAGDRLDDIGYHWRTYGENIAFGYREEKEVVRGWILSPGHCKNIMNKAYKEMGVARVGDYWTQVFATQ